MERLGYLIVPRNREGMVGQMAGDADRDDLLFFAFTQAEIDAARPLLQAFEATFGFDSRGALVEQLIDTRYTGIAGTLARERARISTSEPERAAASRIAEALAAAEEFGSYVEFALE